MVDGGWVSGVCDRFYGELGGGLAGWFGGLDATMNVVVVRQAAWYASSSYRWCEQPLIGWIFRGAGGEH